ncbi:MAG: hypothetical protein P1P83_10440 [Bacteroidales bacterium]|nr:hypothetical protein [Bacteroidales bacterium]MDT8374407.1 hypothetical protein [Bacteroidales bacterium]
MSKKFDDKLSEKLRELPFHSPAVSLWEEIETALDTEEAIRSKIHDLPMHTASHGNWEAIEAALREEQLTWPSGPDVTEPQVRTLQRPSERDDIRLYGRQRAGHRRKVIYLATAAAAAVFLLLAIPWLVRPGQEIVVESEVVLSEGKDYVMKPDNGDEDPLQVISNLCKTGAPICQSDLFREKFQLYNELNQELRQLETIIGQVGDSPEIIKSVIQIENLKSDTLQELIQLIHS